MGTVKEMSYSLCFLKVLQISASLVVFDFMRHHNVLLERAVVVVHFFMGDYE